MQLSETTTLMNSKDYKERFKAEYYQTNIRYEKLKTMLVKWDNNTLNFVPACSRETYNLQLKAMQDYLSILQERAKQENINL